MKDKVKPVSIAQQIFGKEFGNRQILNERPEGMDFRTYRGLRKAQVKIIRRCLH